MTYCTCTRANFFSFPLVSDFSYIEDLPLPDDLLRADLPTLDGPATADLSNSLSSLNSAPPLPGLNSTPPNNAQALPGGPTPSPMKQLSQAAPGAGAQPGSLSPASSSTPLSLNTSNPRIAGLSSSAGAPSPNTAVVSTTAHPTPSLPNISSTPANPFPSNAAPPNMAAGSLSNQPVRPPSASASYSSYMSMMSMSSSAPAISSQMNTLQHQPQQSPQQQAMGYMGNPSAIRHPTAHTNMHTAAQTAGMGMVARQRGMMVQQPGVMQMGPRTIVHSGHGAALMSGHPQQTVGMHSHLMMNRAQAPVGSAMMSSGMMQHGHGAMAMPPGIHHTAYNPRTGYMQHGIVPNRGIPVHRIQAAAHQMQHPSMHSAAMHTAGIPVSMRQPMQATANPALAHQHQYSVDPSGYQGHLRPGYGPSQAPQGSALPPSHSHPGATLPGQMAMSPQQMMSPQHALGPSNLAPASLSPQQNMLSQQQQQPCPPAPVETLHPQGGSLAGQLASMATPQLQVATPPQPQASPISLPPQGRTPPIVSVTVQCVCMDVWAYACMDIGPSRSMDVRTMYMYIHVCVCAYDTCTKNVCSVHV